MVDITSKGCCDDFCIAYEKCGIPQYFKYVAYFLCTCWLLFFGYIILLYGIIYPVQVNDWLFTTFASVLSDMFIVQTLKVVLLVGIMECFVPRNEDLDP